MKEMKELTDKLASIGAAISEEDQVVTLLGSLLSSYSTIVTALEAHVDGVSLDFVQQALRQGRIQTPKTTGMLGLPRGWSHSSFLSKEQTR